MPYPTRHAGCAPRRAPKLRRIERLPESAIPDGESLYVIDPSLDDLSWTPRPIVGPRAGVAPVAVIRSLPEAPSPSPPLPTAATQETRATRARPALRAFLRCVYALAVLGIAIGSGSLVWWRLDKQAAVSRAATPSPSEERHRAADEPRAVSVHDLPEVFSPAAAGLTIVKLSKRAAGHRVYIDGRVHAGSTWLPVRCGRHTIRVGSRGRARELDLPCGGELALR